MSKLVAILLPTSILRLCFCTGNAVDLAAVTFFPCNYILFSDKYFSVIDIHIDFHLITGAEIIYITSPKSGSDPMGLWDKRQWRLLKQSDDRSWESPFKSNIDGKRWNQPHLVTEPLRTRSHTGCKHSSFVIILPCHHSICKAKDKEIPAIAQV